MVTLPPSGLLRATVVVWGEPGLMLVELSVVEQRYHTVMEVISGGVPVVEVAERYGVSRKTGARLAAPLPRGGPVRVS